MAMHHISTSLGTAATALGLAMATLDILIASSLEFNRRHSFAFALVAAVIQLIACFALTALLLLRLRPGTSELPRSQKPLRLILILGVFPSLAALIVIGISLGWVKGSFADDSVFILGTSVSVFLTVTFAIWGISILIHLLYFTSLVRLQKSCSPSPSCRLTIEEAPQEMVEPNQPAADNTDHSNPFREQSMSSPPSLIHSDGTSSMRSSFSTIQRPSSSKKDFSVRQNSYSHPSRGSSTDGLSWRPSQDEGFDSWDTSGVSSHIREAVLSKGTMKVSGLEPIPGSRSPSPAKALEGPFFQSSPSISPPSSPLPQPPVSRSGSPPSSPLEVPNFTTMFPPASPSSQIHNFSRPGSRSRPVSRSATISRSRPSSRSRAPSSEDHIHPLFRTSSPGLPPATSPNTTVTAAPEAGQLINENALRRIRSRSNSLQSSSPLVRCESSPNIRDPKAPMSPGLDVTAVPFSVGSRPHQRKRSASFQGTVEG